MDDAGQAKDDRVADGDEAVHGAHRKPARKDLESDGHAGSLYAVGFCP